MPTLSELRTRVRVDSPLTTGLISNANLNLLLVEGALHLAKDGHAMPIVSATWSAAASAQTYILSGASAKVSNFLDIYWPPGGLVYAQTSSSTKTAPGDFQFVSESWLDLNRPGWQDDSASDTLQHAYLSFDSSGYLVLGVHPKSSTTTPTFKLYFLSRGTDMSDDSNYPWTNSITNLTHTEPYQVAIAYYAMAILYKTKVYNEVMADYYIKQYLALAAMMRESQAKIFATEIEGLTLSAQAEAGETFGSL